MAEPNPILESELDAAFQAAVAHLPDVAKQGGDCLKSLFLAGVQVGADKIISVNKAFDRDQWGAAHRGDFRDGPSHHD